MTAPRLFTLTEAGDHIGVSAKTIRRLVASGELNVVDVTATAKEGAAKRPRLRIREDELSRWIDKRTEKSA